MAALTFSLHIKDIDPEAFAILNQLDAERAKLIEGAKKKLAASERFKAAIDLAKVNDYGRKSDPAVNFDGRSFHVSVIADDAKPVATPRPYLSIGEKTLNALLHSKQLSDSEKRQLISAATNGLISAEARA